jgi:uncharacterized phage protein (TIGR01671 family)
MREIKFRAWDKEKKCMFQVTEMNFRSNGRVYSVSPNQGDDFYLVEDEVEVMQYTGFKDKNNNEIWEGDIIKSDKGYMFKVIYHNEWVSFALQDLKDKDVIIHFVFDDEYYAPKKIEKIGNIFENKDIVRKYNPNRL